MPSFLLGSTVRGIETDLVGRIQVAAADAAAGSVGGVMGLAAAFGSRIGNRADVARVHARVAAEMRAGILSAYETSVEAGRVDYGPRAGSPARLSGRLRAALEDDALVVGTVRGIDFVDSDRLYKAAKHYARLNFGTAGPGDHGRPARGYPVSLFGSVLFTVAIHRGPSPAFYLPKGLFLGGGGWTKPSGERRGTGVFYPLSELPSEFLKKRASKTLGYDADHPTKAIEARRFLDAGLAVMSEELPAAYNRLVRSWFSRGTKGGQVYLDHLNLRGGRVPQNLAQSKQVRVTA